MIHTFYVQCWKTKSAGDSNANAMFVLYPEHGDGVQLLRLPFGGECNAFCLVELQLVALGFKHHSEANCLCILVNWMSTGSSQIG